MQNRPAIVIHTCLLCLMFALSARNLSASDDAEDEARLQELLYGEALFYSHQQDYLAAINRLQLAEARSPASLQSEDARLLLARMKLAYGMHLEAGFDLHGLPGETVPVEVKNRAWYELSRAFFHKGYRNAAAETLALVEGELPADIVGDHQLLRATVLMSLDRNREAAQELAQWRGEPELAAYAHYNRGIALVRAGDYSEVAAALELAVAMPATGEELLALRDKSHLALGYSFARDGEYKKARRQLEAVRAEGPFSNRALLALGWIAYQQGHSESALVSWTALRGRSPTDPAVLETLLIVPAVHRELASMQSATRDYEAAMEAYSDELNRLHDARASVQEGAAVSQLLQNGEEIRGEGESRGSEDATRFFGPLLASRHFSEVSQDHGELRAMLDNIDRGLFQVDPLVNPSQPAGDDTPVSMPPMTPDTSAHERAQSQAGQTTDSTNGRAQWQQEWVRRQGKPTSHPAAPIPQLPQVQSPARRTLKPFPERQPSSPPPVSSYLREPPSSEIFGLPDSEILWLPNSGDFFNRPQSGEFFRRPGEEPVEDYAYPDLVPGKRSIPGKSYQYPVNSLLSAGEAVPGFNPGAVPVGKALRDLATALSATTERVVELEASYDSTTDSQTRIAALRTRIVKLRSRIASAIVLHENYTRALALEELDRRQQLLEGLLEQASLELAKTYDQSSDP